MLDRVYSGSLNMKTAEGTYRRRRRRARGVFAPRGGGGVPDGQLRRHVAGERGDRLLLLLLLRSLPRLVVVGAALGSASPPVVKGGAQEGWRWKRRDPTFSSPRICRS